MTAKEMLLGEMIVEFPEKTREELSKEIAIMSWAERMEKYGKYRAEAARQETRNELNYD